MLDLDGALVYPLVPFESLEMGSSAMRIRDDAKWLVTRPIAHRGLHDSDQGIPENSLASFDRASINGFPAELDVQLSNDGHVVVFHDTNLIRMTGMNAVVHETSYSVMSRLRLHESDERIPTLTEVLDLVDDRVPIIVEVKSAHAAGNLEGKVLKILRSRKQTAAIVSFNPRSLRYFRAMAPELPLGQNSGLFRKTDLEEVNLNP